MERQLASIRRIGALASIDGADRIEKASVDGWEVVVVKGEFSVGDLAAYYEIDSVLPADEPAYEFLRAQCLVRAEGLGEGIRIKTRKFRGVISQGLALPLARVPLAPDVLATLREGDDVTAALRVRKYELPETHQTAGQSPWPAFLRKTDQPRVQNMYAKLRAAAATASAAGGSGTEHSDGGGGAAASAPAKHSEWGAEQGIAATFEVTLKLDGMSCTAYHNNGTQGVCSRNVEVMLVEGAGSAGAGSAAAGDGPDAAEAAGGNLFLRLGRPVAARLAALGLNLAVQGEVMGPKVQGNREGLDRPQLFVFDIFDIDAQVCLLPPERRALCERLGLAHVPVLEEACRVFDRFAGVADVLVFADRRSMRHAIAEGVVFKANHGGQSFKAVSNRFLLKCEA
jgi:hypothetical protein